MDPYTFGKDKAAVELSYILEGDNKNCKKVKTLLDNFRLHMEQLVSVATYDKKAHTYFVVLTLKDYLQRVDDMWDWRYNHDSEIAAFLKSTLWAVARDYRRKYGDMKCTKH